MRVLVTGASGFVGQALCVRLREHGFEVRRALRSIRREEGWHDDAVVGDIGPETDWRAALEGVDRIVHLAARCHVLRNAVSDSLGEYRRVNVEGTQRLAETAAQAGVGRFVFVSSVKVNGDGGARPYTDADRPHPRDGYAISKWEAEQVLMRIGKNRDMDWVILRPPLTYGPGVRANFQRLLWAVHRGLPLPLGAVDNRRSLLYVGNLADAIQRCLLAPQAACRTFLVSDGEDVSSPELIRRLARALGVKPRLIPVPVAMLRVAGRLTGRSATVDRLLGSLQIDCGALQRTLQWQPPFTLDQGLERTAHWYLDWVA